MSLDKTPWTDDTVMPWGAHQGTRLADLPDAYLLWLSDQRWISDWPGLHAYLETNAERLKDARLDEDEDNAQIEGWGSYEDYLKDYRGF